MTHHRFSDFLNLNTTDPTLIPDEEVPSAEKLAVIDEKLTIFSAIVDGLPTRAREAFVLSKVYVYGMTYAEIAKELHISASAVWKLLAKALLRCERINSLFLPNSAKTFAHSGVETGKYHRLAPHSRL